MCGIAGIVGGINNENRAALQRMTYAIRHRGPDGTGTWESTPDPDGRGCMFAHVRLAILDLTSHAHQPMVDPTTGHVIAFNGEIYNFALLRARLQQQQHTFTSTGDTEVLLRWLATQGTTSLDETRGMYALALWDPQTRRVTFARDPHGIKPLYLCFSRDVGGTDDWSILFASEIRAILASGLIPSPRIDPVAVASVMWNGFVTGPNTIVRGIRSMWPGETFVADTQGRFVSRSDTWRIPLNTSSPSPAQPLYDTLADSVACHLHADAPVSVFLSSGIDSSAIANLAHKARARPIDTFTLAFEEHDFNEGNHARHIAQAIGTRHREYVLTESAFKAAIEHACQCLDQPSFDGINSYYMSKAIRDAGGIVALSGAGGDELFGGYQSFREIPRFLSIHHRTRFAPLTLRTVSARAFKRFKTGRHVVGAQTRWGKLPDLVAAQNDVLRLYQLAYAIFVPAFQRELLMDGISPLPNGLPSELETRVRNETRGAPTLQAISAIEQRIFLGERLLRDIDSASMYASIETRLPLVDRRVTESVARMPAATRYGEIGSKSALADAGLVGLDRSLFNRPKRGFVIPFDRWIRAGLGDAMDQTMHDRNAAAQVGLNGKTVERLWRAYNQGVPGMYWSRVWSIFTLINWGRRTGVSI